MSMILFLVFQINTDKKTVAMLISQVNNQVNNVQPVRNQQVNNNQIRAVTLPPGMNISNMNLSEVMQLNNNSSASQIQLVNQLPITTTTMSHLTAHSTTATPATPTLLANIVLRPQTPASPAKQTTPVHCILPSLTVDGVQNNKLSNVLHMTLPSGNLVQNGTSFQLVTTPQTPNSLTPNTQLTGLNQQLNQQVANKLTLQPNPKFSVKLTNNPQKSSVQSAQPAIQVQPPRLQVQVD